MFTCFLYFALVLLYLLVGGNDELTVLGVVYTVVLQNKTFEKFLSEVFFYHYDL